MPRPGEAAFAVGSRPHATASCNLLRLAADDAAAARATTVALLGSYGVSRRAWASAASWDATSPTVESALGRLHAEYPYHGE